LVSCQPIGNKPSRSSFHRHGPTCSAVGRYEAFPDITNPAGEFDHISITRFDQSRFFNQTKVLPVNSNKAKPDQEGCRFESEIISLGKRILEFEGVHDGLKTIVDSDGTMSFWITTSLCAGQVKEIQIENPFISCAGINRTHLLPFRFAFFLKSFVYSILRLPFQPFFSPLASFLSC
jgi:hypothetical protein